MRFAIMIAASALLTQSALLAQVRPAATKNVDEPARTPYSHTLDATCPFVNVCQAAFPAVPAGKRLRVTRIGVFARNQSNSGFLVLNLNAYLNPIMAFPVAPTNLGYYGTTIANEIAVDYYFEAGQTPVLELGSALNWSTVFMPKLRVTGYLVDLTM